MGAQGHRDRGPIIGAAFARGRGIVDKTTIGRLVITWVLTLPATALLSAGLYVSLSPFITF